MIDKKKIFLASSEELADDRQAFELFVNRKNKDWIDKGVFIELIVWEDFLDALSKTRLQDEYNRAIRECDLFVMLFWTKAGRYTAEEFETAFRQFQSTRKPFIFTYFKDAPPPATPDPADGASLAAFKSKLDGLGHFYTRYTSVEGLQLNFSRQLDKLVKGGFIEFEPDRGPKAKPPIRDYYEAMMNGDGAIAQGSEAMAVSRGGVAVRGDNSGDINTGTRIDTGGGAYVGGSVNTGGGAFTGRDSVANSIEDSINNSRFHAGGDITIVIGDHPTTIAPPVERDIREDIRLDVAAPAEASVGTEFDVAVAIRQTGSPPLKIDDLLRTTSQDGFLLRAAEDEIVAYRVEIKSSNFLIDPPRLIFNLEAGQDSEPKWFKLIAKKPGSLSFVVIAYQVDGDVEIASTRVNMKVLVESVPPAQDSETLFAALLAEVARRAPPARLADAIGQARALGVEAAKSAGANDGQLATLVAGLAEMAPGTGTAIADWLATPMVSAGVGTVTRIVLERLKGG